MKAELRRQILELLKGMSCVQKKKADASLLESLCASEAYQTCQTLATYLSFEHEFDTAPLIERALQDGKRVCVPKTYSQGRMEFMEYQPDNLQKTRFGLLEPGSGGLLVSKKDIDVIHVPGLVFDRAGYRIGYGGGYYDRYLSDFSGETISTIYAFQQGDFETGIYDIAVQEVLVYEDDF